MPAALIRDINIAYDDVGEGLPVIFIHGSPFNRSMWKPQVERFRSEYRVVTYDLRGYGETTVVPGKTTLDIFANDLAGLLNFLGIAPGVVVGLSTGGQIALEFYRQFPQRVSALVLADTSARPESPQGRETRYELAERLVREGMYTFAEEFLLRMLSPLTTQRQPEVAAQVLTMMRTTHPEGVAAALRGRAERRDYLPLLAEIKTPTLIAVGRDDAFTPIAESELMHSGINNSELVVIDEAGHMPNMEQAEAFNEALEQFLKAIAN